MIHGSKESPRVFSIVGHSGAGKTTLVEKLIQELCKRSIKVATIKHAHHTVTVDTPGKDSFRYKEAGAVMSMLVTSNLLQLVADVNDQREPEQLAGRFLGEADLVLAEGFSLCNIPKIEVLRRECGQPPRCDIKDGVIAIVTDVEEVYPQLLHFGLDDIAEIAQFILDHK